MAFFDDELRKLQQQRAQLDAYDQAQQAALDYENKARAAQEAQQQQKPGGLGGVLAGIGESIGNVGKGLVGMFGTGGAAIGDIFSSIGSGKVTTKNQDDFNKWLAGTENKKDAYAKNAGAALDAAATLSDFIPGLGTGAKVALNVGQGAASGVAQELIDNGANASLDNALKNATAGAAAAGAGQFVGNKLAKGVGGNGRIAKAINSNLGRGALTGAAAGAVGGGLGTALNGGDLGQTLSGALQGAGGGALGGATMAGVMGLAGTGIDKLNQKVAGAPTAQNIPEAPVKQRVIETETTPTRKGIAITDYDAGEQPITVRRANAQSNEYNLGKNAGSLIDGVLGPDNDIQLKNAKRPTDAALFRKQTGGEFDNAADFLRKYPQELENIKKTYPEVYEAVRKGARDYSDLNALQFDGTGAENKSGLPDLNRQQYYEDTIGKLHNKTALGETSTSAADVPDYMRNHLLNDTTGDLNGQTLRNDDILREFFRGQYGDSVDSMDLNELYGAYERLAQAANQNEIYTPENIANGIRMNGINDDVTGAFVNDLGLRQNIGVDQYPSLRQNVEVMPGEAPMGDTVYTRRILNPQTQQTVAPAQQADMPVNAGTIRRQTPTGWADEDLTGAAQKQNFLQKFGNDLQNAAEATRDSAIYGKLKGNTAQEMINKGAIDNLRNNYGYAPDDYAQASKLSTAINKWYDNEIKSSGAEKVNTKLSSELALPMNNTLPDKYEKAYAQSITNAMNMASAGDSNVIDKYSASGLERAAKYLGEQEQKMRRTSMNGVDGRVDGDRAELADYYKAARQKLRSEVNSMIDLDDITKNNLAKLLDNAGATPEAKNTILRAQTFSEVKSATSPLEDARTMYNQMRSSGLKRGANADNSTNIGTQLMRNTGLNNMTDVAGKPIRAGMAKLENTAGKAIGAIGDAIAGGATGGAAGKALGSATKLARAANSNIQIDAGPYNLNDLATRQIARQAGKAAVNDTNIANEQANAQNALTEAQSAYNMAVGNYQNAVAQGQQLEQQMSQGAQQLQRISSAMDAALAAGDIASYGKLADLYQQAYKIYGADTTASKTEAKALSANQSKALAAQQQLEQLAIMRPDAGTAMADIPVLSNLIGLTGGNEYANQAKALATTLGYLLSGANIKESEAERIGQSYVPNAYDSEAVRQQKLARARQLIQSYMGDTNDLAQA